MVLLPCRGARRRTCNRWKAGRYNDRLGSPKRGPHWKQMPILDATTDNSNGKTLLRCEARTSRNQVFPRSHGWRMPPLDSEARTHRLEQPGDPDGECEEQPERHRGSQTLHGRPPRLLRMTNPLLDVGRC